MIVYVVTKHEVDADRLGVFGKYNILDEVLGFIDAKLQKKQRIGKIVKR